MAQIEQGDIRAFNPADWAAMARYGIDRLVNAQLEIWDQIRAVNQHWLDRISAEGKLGADFASKLAATHTVPEAVNVCQEFGRRQFEMIAENTTYFAGETQKAMQNGVRIFNNGLATGVYCAGK